MEEVNDLLVSPGFNWWFRTDPFKKLIKDALKSISFACNVAHVSSNYESILQGTLKQLLSSQELINYPTPCEFA